jgi:hypothetical protein
MLSARRSCAANLSPHSHPYLESSMAINTQKVVVGGLAAGLVMNVVDFVVFGYLLRGRMDAELAAAAPTLVGKGMGGSVIAAHVITDFLIGILIVWLYAAIRPRFGPGMGTAVKAALVVWVCGFLFYQDWLHMGMMSMASYLIVAVTMFITLFLAAWVGAKLYTEGGGAPMV